MLEANKKQVPLKSYSLELRINSVNQILKNNEKVIWTSNKLHGPELQTRRLGVYVFMSVKWYKNSEPVSYNSLHHAGNRKYFLGLSLYREIEGKCTCFTRQRKMEKL